jgi:hypothetical protein
MDFPLPEGYDENTYAVQLGRGIGSMLSGIPVRMLTGPVGTTAFFAAMGAGEATQRAVRFDAQERAAGRPGLTQEQIITAGLLGIGPGATDVAPVELWLRGLPVRMPAVLRASLAQSIGRIGGQAFVEGIQEGGQQAIQNLIAWQVYNPNQVLTEDVWWNSLVGGGVGVTVQGGTELVRGGLNIVRRGGRTAPQPQTAPPPEQAEPQARATPSARRAPPNDDTFGAGAVVRRLVGH